MKHLVAIKKGKLEWREAPEVRIASPGQAVVRPIAVGRCDADSLLLHINVTTAMKIGVAVHFLDPKVIDTFGKSPLKGPVPIGHECVAEVLETGESVTAVRRGDRVIVPWAISCGECALCAKKMYAFCNRTGSTGTISAYGWGEPAGNFGGMICDRLLVPFADAMLVRLPPNMDPTHAVGLADNVSDAYRSVGPYLEKNAHSPVLVMGGAAKSIGLYAAAIAVAMGSERVDYVDSSPERLRIAKTLGANPIEAVKQLPTGSSAILKDGYPITVDASGDEKRLQFALKSLAHGGDCSALAFHFKTGTPLPLWDMYLKDANFHTGLSHPRRDIPKVLALMAAGKFKPEMVTTRVAEWETAHESYLEKTTKLVLARKAEG